MKLYTLTVTEQQLRLLSEACNVTSRIYRGIPDTIDLFDVIMIENGAPQEHRTILEETLRIIRKLINPKNRTDGKGSKYDRILHDMHQVIRNQFYKESGSGHYGVNSSVHPTGDEPMMKIQSPNTQ